MDFMTTRNPHLLLEAALAEGLALGLRLKEIKGVPHPFDPEPDAWVRLAIGETTMELPVLVRREVTPDTLGAIAQGRVEPSDLLGSVWLVGQGKLQLSSGAFAGPQALPALLKNWSRFVMGQRSVMGGNRRRRDGVLSTV